jgi:outer membrane protein OmpA-like peptidoglycan-associated protein
MNRPRSAALVAAALGATVLGAAAPARAQHSGIDSTLFRPSVDTSGVFSVEGARLMPKHDLSWKFLVGYGAQPFQAAVPGIGGAGDEDSDAVLKYLATVEMVFGMSLSSKFAIGFDVAAYRTDTGEGYGERGRFGGTAGSSPSSGLISLRPLSNFDPSGGYLPEELSGPLDTRIVGKYAILADKNLALTAMLGVSMPFGDEEMFLGDKSYVFEPKVLLDYRFDQVHATKFVANLGARLRERTVLEAYDRDTEMPVDAKVVADVGSEITAGAGFLYELGQNLTLGVEGVGFVPLPGAITFGDCTTYNGVDCSDLSDDDYYADAKEGDLAAYATAGAGYRASPHLTVNLMAGASLIGMRGDDFRVIGGITWSPQPKGVAEIGRGDRDGDGIPDVSDSCMEDTEDRDGYQDDDGCPDVDNDGDGVVDANDSCADEPEDRDGFQDDDGCPERDNDGDSITDVADRCPDAKEDLDSFEDDDGCPEEDNDGDGFPDASDKCPNDAETVNGVDDDDGCPDSRSTTGPQEGTDRIDLRGNRVEFTGNSDKLTQTARNVLGQVARLMKDRGLSIRVEVHVALGTNSKSKAAIKRQQGKDRDLSRRRAQAILDYLIAQGVPNNQVDATGLGSDRPITQPATDPLNERVDFIKRQQRNP